MKYNEIKTDSPATDDPRSAFTCGCGGGWPACGGGWTACGAGPDYVQKRIGTVGYTDYML